MIENRELSPLRLCPSGTGYVWQTRRTLWVQAWCCQASGDNSRRLCALKFLKLKQRECKTEDKNFKGVLSNFLMITKFDSKIQKRNDPNGRLKNRIHQCFGSVDFFNRSKN